MSRDSIRFIYILDFDQNEYWNIHYQSYIMQVITEAAGDSKVLVRTVYYLS